MSSRFRSYHLAALALPSLAILQAASGCSSSTTSEQAIDDGSGVGTTTGTATSAASGGPSAAGPTTAGPVTAGPVTGGTTSGTPTSGTPTSGTPTSGGTTTGGGPIGGPGGGPVGGPTTDGTTDGGMGGNTSVTGGGPTTGATTGGNPGDCVLPELPDDVSSLPRNEKLPDPFTFFDGTPVTTKAQWECRRREIQYMAAKYIYGPYPFEPDETTGTVSGGNISITCTEGDKTEQFTATINGSGSVITVTMGSLGAILPSGGKSLTFGSGFEGKIKNLFGLSENPLTNVATGWMVDRVIEVLEKNPDSGHDPEKMAVSGCSGCGKAAFLVGAFSRIPMTVIVESGGGGAANLRQVEWFRHDSAGQALWDCPDGDPQGIDNLENSGACTPWVGSMAQPIRSQPDLVNHLPFDQHLLLATMAPRYLVHFSNDNGNGWCHLAGTSEGLSAWAAYPVWEALGVPERMAMEIYSGGHCSTGDTGIAAAMFDRAFNGNTSAQTGGIKIMDSRVQQPVGEWEAMWIDWNMDTVLE